MPQYLEVTAPPILTHGAEDTWNQFDSIYTDEVLASLSNFALEAARAAVPEIQDADIWASGFAGGYSAEDLGATDAAKLAHESSTLRERPIGEEWMGFEGDDSNEVNVAEREVYSLRDEKLRLAKELANLDGQGLLTPGKQADARARIGELNEQIDAIRAASQAGGNLPIYYATPVSGMLDRNPENNPLSYIGDVPGTGFLALYNGRTAMADPTLRVTEKTDRQVRIAGPGLRVMRHTLAVARLEFVE